jgi:predicted metal-dependent HD superfamily phosphohydrolase
MILSKVKKFVGKIFRQKSFAKRYYHNFTHTSEVVKVTKEISSFIGVSDEDKEMLLIAAWFHDVGYTEQCNEHENLGIEMAASFLKANGYSEEKIKRIASLINSTKMPRNPQSLLEEIICDADLYHLGTNESEAKEKLFRKELEILKGCKIKDKDWLENNLTFFAQHKFYTTYAKEKFGAQKNDNFIKLQQRLKQVNNKFSRKINLPTNKKNKVMNKPN